MADLGIVSTSNIYMCIDRTHTALSRGHDLHGRLVRDHSTGTYARYTFFRLDQWTWKDKCKLNKKEHQKAISCVLLVKFMLSDGNKHSVKGGTISK